ncbi:conserved hypothetical protein [Verrucomicrobia bacterium]|nr:conserved hypothetical protein [Verrucomicrobiota bacterium]
MNQTQKTFEGLLSGYFEQFLEDTPTVAAFAGIRSAEGRLGTLSLDFEQKRERQRQTALRALEQISPRELANEQQMDRLALRARLLQECEDHARERHTLEPHAPSELLGILLHELLRADEEPRRAAKNLRSLLAQAPDFLDEAASVVRRPEQVWLRVMEQTVAGGAVLLEGVGEFLGTVETGDGTKPRKAARPGKPGDSPTKAAQRALERYRATVKRQRLAPPGSFAVGAAALQRRVHEELGLDYTLGQVESLALSEVDRVLHLLQAACARFGRKRPAHQILAELRARWHPAKPLLELYQGETRRIAEGFRHAGAVSFPQGDQLLVKPVPEFLRRLIPTAAYNQPGAFEKRQRGVFWVNDLSLTKDSAAEKLAEQQQHFGLPLTCAHEAYPGHHLQFVTANRHPRKWRRLFAHAVFYEGWTLWCEQMLVDLKIDRSPWVEVQQLHDALWRCHRILVDLRLQTGRYTYDQAVRHLQKHVAFTRARAEADVNWYTASPGVPMSYWLGRLENERLRQRLIQGRGWSLRKFNDWLLSFGTIPQAWIEKYGLD